MYIPPFHEMLQASRAMGSRSNAPDLWRGCVLKMPLADGGGGTACDLARNNAGTWNGTGDHHAIGRLGRCGQFNGTDDYVEVSQSLDTTDLDWFIGAWVYLDEYPADGSEMAIFGDTGGTNDDGVFVNKDGDVFLRVDGSIGTKLDDTPIPVQTWTHILITKNASTDEITLYMDGREMLIFGEDDGGNPWRDHLTTVHGWTITDGGAA